MRDSVVGEECHIVSGQMHGPRNAEGLPAGGIDCYENLILLCRIHHKQVDDQVGTFSGSKLREIKDEHERWVRAALSDGRTALLLDPIRLHRKEASDLEYLPRLDSGKEVFAVMDGSFASSFDHDELECTDEVELIGSFLQLLQDWGDLSGDLEPAQKVEVGFQFNEHLAELQSVGFWVFGAKQTCMMTGGGKGPFPWPVALIRVCRSSNPDIILLSEQEGTPDRG